MDLQKTIRDAIVAELNRQAGPEPDAPKVDTSETGYAVIAGRIDIDALIMAIEGAVAGGP
ncbi:hypothetical protein [Methylobacterium oryzihabitans]|jgi:hypothetical protein|uniref:Uncharacterized protein n=1 Tax=Methylobacterium oryzihabitans TaxID=2499852 RepID=A0A437NVZ4_9HYPH|nr:hypothetical protein [Methylobacterium oryzihabitans]RVU14198.1 hypothetical protein EOE48_24340 [Methylobacterium oryzihabitans]